MKQIRLLIWPLHINSPCNTEFHFTVCRYLRESFTIPYILWNPHLHWICIHQDREQNYQRLNFTCHHKRVFSSSSCKWCFPERVGGIEQKKKKKSQTYRRKNKQINKTKSFGAKEAEKYCIQWSKKLSLKVHQEASGFRIFNFWCWTTLNRSNISIY